MENRNWSDNERKAVAGLVAAWDALVAEGGMDEAELAGTLVEQLDGSTQGWDGSMEDAEANPELAALVGLDPEADPETDAEMAAWDEAVERWGRVVAEAARQWLARELEGDQPAQQPAEPTQPSNAVARRLAGILARAAEEAEEMGEAEEAGRARQLADRLASGQATEAEWLEALDWVDPE